MINEQHFTWGAFISAVITFVLTAAVVYFVVVLPVKAHHGAAHGAARRPGPAEPDPGRTAGGDPRPAARAAGRAVRAHDPVRSRHDVPCRRPALVAAPVRRAVLQVAAVVVRGSAGRSPQPTSLSSGARAAGPGPAAAGGSAAAAAGRAPRAPRPPGSAASSDPAHGELAAPGPGADDHEVGGLDLGVDQQRPAGGQARPA